MIEQEKKLDYKPAVVSTGASVVAAVVASVVWSVKTSYESRTKRAFGKCCLVLALVIVMVFQQEK